ncbi:MAG: YihA family ribosome biogenesis GTP-binding protein [Myxococcales bacterium]|nr:YihA family ribosome biogenesis GTP-binding protein [Myxococcales bacterium]MCB9709277.1 YihA family ribosome biogenesis GTP-binding protein [Myxococcales bacterium]
MKNIVQHAEFVAAAISLSSMPPPLYAEVCFAGRSNVGKSSLINSLLGRRSLARTSSRPGHTRTLNFYRVQTTFGMLDFVDLPGYGYARRSKTERQAWAYVMRDFFSTRNNLRATVLVIDARRGLQPEDQQVMNYGRDNKLAVSIVATKIDKLAPAHRMGAVKNIAEQSGAPVIGFSATTPGLGHRELWGAILESVGLHQPKALAGEK